MGLRLHTVILLLACSAALPLSAQDIRTGQQAAPWSPQLLVMGQFWATYTHGGMTWDSTRSTYLPDEGQANILLRRARVGLRGALLKDLTYTAVVAFDQVGHDPRSGTGGATNNGSFPQVGLIDAFVVWKLPGCGETAVVSGGYLRPQYGREHLTGGFVVNSMEKMATQNYMRAPLIGSIPGRAPGWQVGGLLGLGKPFLHLRYDAGLFMAPIGPNGGYPLLFTGRLAWQIGHPESRTFTLAPVINHFGRRNGLTLALNAAWRGAGGGKGASRGLGADLLLNQGPWQLDAEIHRLARELHPAARPEYRMYTGHVRLGCNIWRTPKGTLEPVVSWVFFRGGMDAADQQRAAQSGLSAGRESALEAGLNWWLNPLTVVQLSHTWRSGDPGAAGPGATVNPYFLQSEVGAIRRGHWFGIGLRFQR